MVKQLTADPLDLIIGTSEAINQLKSLIRQVAVTGITVLITGESGTGKELVAHSIHSLSTRRNEPMVTVNCGAIPEGIFESEVFGHEKGSFTSADRRRQGYFEMADRGTLFLDEIGEMPLQVQVKLLRVLETGRFLRVGGSSEVQVDVRIIAASNRDLAREVSQGKFRQDLYYRLKAINIFLPPLRDRREDIPLLIDHLTNEFAVKNNLNDVSLTSQAIEILSQQYWEGNVRELKNYLESIITLSSAYPITGAAVQSFLKEDTQRRNLPILVPRPEIAENIDGEVIYRTLLELRYELSTIKVLLNNMLSQWRHKRDIPIMYEEQGDAIYQLDEVKQDKAIKGRDLWYEITDLKALIKQLLKDRREEIRYPFTTEEIETYSLDEVEREQIRLALVKFNGNRRKAAEALGIGERTLYRKIKQYNLT